MATGVVEALDVPEEPESGLLARGESLAAEEFLLERSEEALGERVVEGIPDRAHREVDPRLLRRIDGLFADRAAQRLRLTAGPLQGWNVGAAIVTLDGEPYPFHEPFWFAVAAFRPDIEIVKE